MSNFRVIDRDTPTLLPPSVQDWLPPGHLARYVVEVVETLDLRECEQDDGGRGSAAYHPAILLSLLIYGYATGCNLSRKIEARAAERPDPEPGPRTGRRPSQARCARRQSGGHRQSPQPAAAGSAPHRSDQPHG